MCNKKIEENTKALEMAVITAIKEMEEQELEYVLPEEIKYDKEWE